MKQKKYGINIIIPTLNEEKLLPFLLELIKKENTKNNIEVIVADAGSFDKTRQIAKFYGCKVVPGGLPQEEEITEPSMQLLTFCFYGCRCFI